MTSEEKVSSIKLEMNELIRGKWIPVRVIGSGSFGKVVHVMNIQDGTEAAMKMEKTEEDRDSMLKIEREVMVALRGFSSAVQLFEAGTNVGYRYIIMTLCGMDLQKAHSLMNGKFSDSTIIRIAIRSLLALKTLHEACYIHRDLKPCNVALDYKAESPVIYLIDFGMGRQYAMKTEDNLWIIRHPRETCRFRGTYRYCSLRMHKRQEQGRVDDLFAWIYMIVELRVTLPWADCLHQDKIENIKKESFVGTLKTPLFANCFEKIHTHLESLTYPDRPDYNQIYNWLKEKMVEVNAKHSEPLDFDAHRVTKCPELEAIQKKYTKKAPTKETVLDEKAMEAMLDDAFKKNDAKDVPGGSIYVVRPLLKLSWGSVTPAKPEEVEQEEEEEKKAKEDTKKEEVVKVDEPKDVKKEEKDKRRPKEKQRDKSANEPPKELKLEKSKDSHRRTKGEKEPQTARGPELQKSKEGAQKEMEPLTSKTSEAARKSKNPISKKTKHNSKNRKPEDRKQTTQKAKSKNTKT